jgi:hypothetical protein
VLSGRAPGDPLYQALAATAGASIGGLIAAVGILVGTGTDDIRITLGGLAVGAIVLGISYLFFRHGSERAQGDFKDKGMSAGDAVKQLQQLGSQLKVG